MYEDSAATDVHKKHKKHKKKHKRRRAETEDGYKVVPESSADIGGSPKGSLKLKLKLGAKTVATKNVVTVQPEYSDTQVDVIDEPWVDEVDPTILTKKHDDDTSDEEREWLSALEKGELNDYGELSKQKDPTLMTARQRAMKHGKQEELMELPTGYKPVELTEEQLQRRQQRAHKRRQMAHEKREKEKKQTLERLLKKQEGRKAKARGTKKAEVPKFRYSDTASGIAISIPQGFQFPFATQPSRPVPESRAKCGLQGCRNDKKYSCSKTGLPLCSLECYKKNLANHKLQFPQMVT